MTLKKPLIKRVSTVRSFGARVVADELVGESPGMYPIESPYLWPRPRGQTTAQDEESASAGATRLARTAG